MTTRLVFALGVAMGLVLSAAPAQAREGSQLGLTLRLNGERVRPVQSDGGGLMLWTVDAGVATVTVTAGSTVLVECPTAACHICGPGSDGTWDAGCNVTIGDPNYGSPIASGGYRFITLRDTTTTLRGVPATSSATCSCAVYTMR